MTSKYYKVSEKTSWTGRKTASDQQTEYWYQVVQVQDVLQIEETETPIIGLLGYACEEGVRRNQGRIGAAQAPDLLRQRLGKLACHFQPGLVADYGNLICTNQDLEQFQEAFAATLATLLQNNVFPIALGGGHDIAYAHFLGIQKALASEEKPRIGVINFDAHFDLRKPNPKGNSGTPFYQILTGYPQSSYFALGIQKPSNTKELFTTARALDVQFLLNTACQSSNLDFVLQQLMTFISQQDYLYISIDMDGFSSAYAPGVSAPSPMGMEPNFVFEVLKFLLDSRKVISCDIAEINPGFDQDNTTTNLGARLIDFIVNHQPDPSNSNLFCFTNCFSN